MFLIFREIPADFPESLALAPDEYRHLRARRIRPGGAVHVGDGRGRRLEYRLRDSGDSIVRITGSAPAEGAEAVVELFTAVPDGRRWDWLLQKATELGATAIQPVRFEYSEARKLKREREERIVLEAAVQSRRFVLPELRDELSLAGALKKAFIDGERRERSPLRVALDPRGERSFATVLGQAGRKGPGVVQIFVGPEGGFSVRELEEFAGADCAVASLGATILRVETAALAGLACLAGLWEIHDWQE